MKIIETDQVRLIIGIELKTTNDNGAAFQAIPLQWARFFEEAILAKIPNKVSDDIYGIYTEFQHEGENNNGTYTFIIGAEVSSIDEMSESFVSTILPKSSYQIFDVAAGHPEMVGEKWQEIWGHAFTNKRTFISDFELYKANGEIEIYIGIV